VLADVPAPVVWYVYAKMESFSTRGATAPAECNMHRSGEVVEVGDLLVKPGLHLSGRFVLSDGATVPEGMHGILSSSRAWDSQTVLIKPDGSFEFRGLGAGEYKLNPAIRGYHLAEESRIFSIEHDTDGVDIKLDWDSGP
jgi:hypothetical protein